MNRTDLSELLGAVAAMAALAGIGYELYGHPHPTGAPERWRVLVLSAVGGVGMYYVKPRQTRELVAMVSAYVPWPGGKRPADPPPAPHVPPPPSVAGQHPTVSAAVVELVQPQTATAAAAHQYDPGA